ncbi:DUF397 domain-containing protein [Longispora sp. NPDC051575]|uniref:DUF397 domain-containing protein n=1 Tax=Longispora sp. NPDC051575 TaxID=3154943 RepID=UPI0034257A56
MTHPHPPRYMLDFGDGLAWHKATPSGDNGGDCLYMTPAGPAGQVGVRDGKAGSAGAVLWTAPGDWAAFLDGVRSGRIG